MRTKKKVEGFTGGKLRLKREMLEEAERVQEAHVVAARIRARNLFLALDDLRERGRRLELSLSADVRKIGRRYRAIADKIETSWEVGIRGQLKE